MYGWANPCRWPSMPMQQDVNRLKPPPAPDRPPDGADLPAVNSVIPPRIAPGGSLSDRYCDTGHRDRKIIRV